VKKTINNLALAAVAALGLGSTAANATVVDITGTPLTALNPFNTTFNLNFSDYYDSSDATKATDTVYFKLTDTYHLSISADNFTGSFVFNQLNLLSNNPTVYILGDITGPYDYIASAIYDYNYVGSNDAAHPIESYNNSGYNPKLTLGPGSYQVNFLSNGNKGTTGLGTFDAHISVAAVPEPETYAMLLAGLGLIGFSARRRKA